MTTRIRRERWVLGAAFLAVVMVTVLAGTLFYTDQKQAHQLEAGTRLVSVAELKVAQILQWQVERHGDASVLASDPLFVGAVQELRTNPCVPDKVDVIAQRLQLHKVEGRYEEILLVDLEGRILARTSESRTPLHDLACSSIAEALEARSSILTDFHRAADDEPLHLDVVTIVYEDPVNRTGPLAGLVFSAGLASQIQPILSTWPTPSVSAETQLLLPDDTGVLVLGVDRSFGGGASNEMRVPFERTERAATRAITGDAEVFEALDHRGAEVLVATRPVPGSAWHVAVKADVDEAYEGLADRLLVIVVLAGSLVVGVAGSTALVWRHRSASFYKERYTVESERAWLQGVIARSVNEVYVFRPGDLRFTFANEGAVRNLGYEVDELLEMTPVDIEECSGEPEYRSMLALLDADEQGAHVFEAVHRRKDGSTYPVEIHIQLVESGSGQVCLAIALDVTERKAYECEIERYREHLQDLVDERTRELASANARLDQINEELVNANEELLHANVELELATRAKSQFLANMSHELRTPMNSVIGFSAILSQGMVGPLTAEQLKQIDMINRAGKHLLALINDILDLSKVEAGAVSVVQERFEASELVREVAETLRPLAAQKEIELVVEGVDQSVEIESDCGKVRQILLNLAGNAVKFTDSGQVCISMEARGQDGIAFVVSDTGPGIAEDDLERVFEAFAQVELPCGVTPKGTGLGLALSAEYARLLGGEVRVTSTVGQGSTFTLLIPAQVFARVS